MEAVVTTQGPKSIDRNTYTIININIYEQYD